MLISGGINMFICAPLTSSPHVLMGIPTQRSGRIGEPGLRPPGRWLSARNAHPLQSTEGSMRDGHLRFRAVKVLSHQRDELLIRLAFDRGGFDLCHPAAIAQWGQRGCACVGFDFDEENHGDRTARCGGGSAPRSAPPRTSAAASAIDGRRGLARPPRLPRPLLDITADQPPHHLRGGEILLGTQALEGRLLPRIDEDGETCGPLFHPHYFLALHVRINHTEVCSAADSDTQRIIIHCKSDPHCL